ncbi:hypothetical protein [Palleronia caenipelagi]|uniref:Uncharacterized protein n=1 Tax=Palleronia caenipelagi TaxID=2489174 RepID=A0A547PW82_9RHOB|nr:hypothetical protein [Palleronia caenipelagi]TRD18393.1 hypothetical protein FEV53_12105 [Palleronia caenipelagi]
MSKPAQTRDYLVTADGWIAGQRRKTGDPVSLTPRQAQYENVTPAEGAAKPEPPSTSTTSATPATSARRTRTTE